MFDVIEVILQLDECIFNGRPVAVVDLRASSDPWLNSGADLIEGDPLLELRDELWAFGARADEAHVTAQDVDPLGNLVEVQSAQNLPDPGDAVVKLPRPKWPACLRVGDHCPELEQGEGAATATDPDLAVKDGTGTLHPLGEGDDRQE